MNVQKENNSGIPLRDEGDRLLPVGAMSSLRERVRMLAKGKNLSTVIACAFDHRTRMLPFILADTHMVPASVHTLGGTLIDAGFENTRIVLQQWNRNFKPSAMRLDGQMPDLLLISAMSLHTAPARDMLRDIQTLPPENRPLVFTGGSACLYEPWVMFRNQPNDTFGPDMAVTGEIYILLEVLERLLETKSDTESLRSAFTRLRDGGGIDDIPGLILPRGETIETAGPTHLIDTGIQRLCSQLDEMAYSDPAYAVLNPPSRKAGLASAPLPASKVARRAPLASLVMTLGCKFRCTYCPIPRYNQWSYRTKSGERIAEELRRLTTSFGFHTYFGADDNFFNDEQKTLSICETLASAEINGKPLRKSVRLSTEVTVHDTLKMADAGHLPLIRKAGFRSFWFGVEDLSGALVRKGQTPDATTRAFGLLRNHGIMPNPMMMHHDAQPLRSKGDSSGLLNQVKILKDAGALTLQVLMLTPSGGAVSYRDMFEAGTVFSAVGNKPAEAHMIDGNYVIAADSDAPWKNQLNLLRAYMSFYNPWETLKRACNIQSSTYLSYVVAQLWGQWGLLHNFIRTLPWAWRLRFQKIHRHTQRVPPDVPMQAPDGTEASHYKQ
jgi:hypothetical protein